MPSFTVAGGNNTFVPHFEATNRLQFSFSRNPESFRLLDYCAMRKVNLSVGLYMKSDNQQASRVVDTNLHEWVDGADRPHDGEGQVGFKFLNYSTMRNEVGFWIGNKAIEQAAFDVVPLNSEGSAQRAMTIRTVKAQAALVAATWTPNTASATSLGGGKWDVGASATPYLLKSCLAAKQAIFKSTQGSVPPRSLSLLITPAASALIRSSPEVIDFIKQQQSSPQLMSDESGEFFEMWGLPRYMYGVKICVEDCVRTTTTKNVGETATKTFTMDDDTAYFLTNTVDVKKNQGELPPGQGVRIYDTITQFMYEDMTVETFQDVNNRRLVGSVVNDYDTIVTCPESGYQVTDILT